MKITNFNSNINYGYNPQYHQKIHEQLSKRKQDKDLANFIIKYDELSLNIEDKIIKLEKDGKTTTNRYESLVTFLIDIKSAIAYSIASCFNSLKYSDSLIVQYLKEMKGFDAIKNPEEIKWRKDLCQSLASYSIKDYPELYDRQRKISAEQLASITGQIDKRIEQMEKESLLGKNEKNSFQMPSVLSLYQKTQNSPNGLQDVVGLEKQKQRLQEDLIEYIENPQQAQKDNLEYGITPPVGYLFFGPPGCGKTYIAQAIASQTGSEMYKMDVSKVGSKYVNQTANNIQEAFDYLSTISNDSKKPILLFMDEVDSLARKRTDSEMASGEDFKTTTTLLKLLDEAKDKNIVVIAATNKFDTLDEAFVNRLDGQYYFGMPDIEQIKDLLVKLLIKIEKGQELAKDEESLKEISKELLGFSNRSITFLFKEAAKNAKRESRREISKEDFIKAIKTTDLERVDEKTFKKHSQKANRIGF